ncbi:MAG: pseudaminic acid cytidylyltransferase [gamma proteobacterium symbiont of Taylorina sp.]|nr:pseudaminic acid cytidylyltransferase [gamma proteobacterium symbiont of Taylorina sp.]
MNLAVIPARGGSKRIPKKNIKNFMGKPIMAYSIEAALNSQLFDEVIVSTDDEEIAEVAKQYGADVPFMRPEELADDFTGTTPVVQQAAHWFTHNGKKPDYICCIYSTSPFIQINYLQAGLEKLKTIDQGSVASFTSFPFPIQRAQKINEKGNMTPFYPEFMPCRSQDLEEAYHDAGQFYWWTEQSLSQGAKENAAIILPRYLVQDIDTLEDWKRAELMYQAMTLSENNE